MRSSKFMDRLCKNDRWIEERHGIDMTQLLSTQSPLITHAQCHHLHTRITVPHQERTVYHFRRVHHFHHCAIFLHFRPLRSKKDGGTGCKAWWKNQETSGRQNAKDAEDAGGKTQLCGKHAWDKWETSARQDQKLRDKWGTYRRQGARRREKILRKRND